MNRDEAIIGNLLDRIRSRFKADPNWGVYDGMLCRSDLEVLLDIISALESDKINNTMNLEHLTADLAAQTAENLALIAKMGERAGQLAAMTAERDGWKAQANASRIEAERMTAENSAFKADIEAGRLVRLPCKPGDTVYDLWYSPCHHGETHPDSSGCCGCEDECDMKRVVRQVQFHSIQQILAHWSDFESGWYYMTEEAARAALGREDGE